MFKLTALPYDYAALTPVLSAVTLELHHDRHHRGYVDKLNELVSEKALGAASLEDLVVHGSGPVFNNAAQVWNHEFYWRSLTPAESAGPDDVLEAALSARFGSLAEFKKRFNTVAASHFGSGWAWLVVDTNGGLEIVDTHDADTPLKHHQRALLSCDLWEHAYYVDYQNDRAKYLQSFWQIVNWQEVRRRYAPVDAGAPAAERRNRRARTG